MEGAFKPFYIEILCLRHVEHPLTPHLSDSTAFSQVLPFTLVLVHLNICLRHTLEASTNLSNSLFSSLRIYQFLNLNTILKSVKSVKRNLF